MKIEEVNDLIRNRRSIYPAMYTDQKVKKDDIKNILENANWAPNHKKTEPWRFRVFTGQSLNTISEYLGSYYQNNTPTEQFSALKYRKTKEKPLQSSHVIAICARLSPPGVVPVWEEKAAVACAVQNMWLTCTALRLGCYWSTPQAALDGGEIFQLQSDEICMGLFYIGIPKEIAFRVPGFRESIDDKVKWL